jgi:hypothetical protein
LQYFAVEKFLLRAEDSGMSKSITMSIRLTPQEKAAVEVIAEATGVPAATLAKASLLACVQAWERDQHIQFPLTVISGDAAKANGTNGK